jgi:hypothetical protein
MVLIVSLLWPADAWNALQPGLVGSIVSGAV